MEYIISNRNFDNAIKYEGYFSNIELLKTQNGFFLFEGYCKSHSTEDFQSIDINQLDLDSLEGVFNLIFFEEDQFVIINDKLGQIPVYYWISGKEFIISNNFWKIIKLLKPNEIQLDFFRLKEQLYFFNTTLEGSTYFKNIKIHKAASQFSFNFKNAKHLNRKYWEFIQKPNNSLSLNDIVEGIDKRIDNHFKYIKENFSDKKIAFGNSGGLDSRIIPHYAKKNNIDLFGITIGKENVGKLGKPTSFKNAKQISELLDFKTYNVAYNSGGFENQMFLDIRNNPLGGSQVFKNPIGGYPEIDIFLCGGNGYTIAYNNAFWSDFSFSETIEQRRKGFIRHFSTEKFLLKNTSKNKLNNFLERKTKEEKNILFEKIFSNEEIQLMHNNAIEFVNEYENIDSFSFIRIVQTRLFNRFSPVGGYESINRLTFPIYLYYPSILTYSQEWPEEVFYNKNILKELIKKINPELAKIPDQANNIIGKTQNKYLKKIKLSLQRTGIDYKYMFGSKEFEDFSSAIFNRPNPLMEEVWEFIRNDYKYNKNINVVSLTLLKIKKILDLVYYKEFEKLENEEFKIKSL